MDREISPMADYVYVTATGVIVPDTADLLATVQAEWRDAFGADLVLTADTPQGVMAVAEALARDAVVRNNAALANQINPDLAGGVFLDALWALTGGQRIKASRSIIADVLLTGQAGTIIAAGSRAAVGADGPQFETVGVVQLDGTGNGVAIFQAVEDGPVAAPVGDLDRIVSGVLGWETVTNPYPATLGKTEETDIAARRRRRATLALQGVALAEAIISGLNNLEGVRSVLFRENYTNADLVIEDQTLPPHSVFACVEGGSDADIAAELLRRKSSGAAWHGDETVATMEPISGQIYQVKFQRPEGVQIYAKFTVQQGTETGDPEAIVKAAALAYVNGELEGEEGFVIGADASPWELAGSVNKAAPGLYVRKVEIGLSALALDTEVIPITISQIAQMFEGNIAVETVA
jgi:hypothetical protein